MWKILGGQVKNQITLNNLRIFLLAIEGMYVKPESYQDQTDLICLNED